MTNHIETITQLLQDAKHGSGDYRESKIAEAQVFATLEVAKNQDVANRIEMLKISLNPEFSITDMEKYQEAILRPIIKGLGLEE